MKRRLGEHIAIQLVPGLKHESYQSWKVTVWLGVVLEAIANVRRGNRQDVMILRSGLRSVEELSSAYPPEPSSNMLVCLGLENS